MKKVLLLLLLSIVVSCGPSAEEKMNTKTGETTHQAVLKYVVDKDGNIINHDQDGCEYIEFVEASERWGGHSGTCPNPIHQYKPEQITTEIPY